LTEVSLALIMAASVSQVMDAVNKACRARGGKYAGYSCQVVSWDDVSRGTVGGSLSCWGANITDTYLESKDGTQLFTVRSDNWNERLGRVTSSEVALVTGNHVVGGANLEPTTLRTFLQSLGEFGSYAGLSSEDLSKEDLDTKCSIRFQTTFLPVVGDRGTLEFASEAYNYNTTDDEDPRNLVLLCTSQGVAVQQDGAGAKRLFHHALDDDGQIHRYWLEAERSEHKVGGPQKETAAEREDATKRGKATASVIGTKAMGTRFNVLMTIQVPLQQQKKPVHRGWGDDGCDFECDFAGCDVECEREYEDECEEICDEVAFDPTRLRRGSPRGAPVVGTANAARVSRGSEFDVWPGLSVRNPERNSSEHVTLTVVIYNTIVGGVPSEEDIVAAIDDLENLYEACGAEGRLTDSTFDFMKEELTVKDALDIETKVTTQPYQPSASSS